MLLQPVEVPGPQPAIPGEPGVELDKRLRSDVVEPTLRFGARVDDARVPEHAQVLGHGGLTQWEALNQLPNRTLSISEKLEDGLTARVADDLKGDGRSHGGNIPIKLYSYSEMDISVEHPKLSPRG
jgi:hypothetical protein